MQFKRILIPIVSLILITCMPFAIAQDEEENDGLARLILITAKDGQSKALEEGITAFHKYMADKEGAWRYQWHSIITGPDTGKYIARSGGHNWGDFDAEHDWDEEADEKFGNEVQPFIADAVVSIVQSDQELGIWPDSMEGYKYFSITRWHVKQGQNRAFSEGLKKIDGILKAADWSNYYAFSSTVSGGHGNTQSLVTPHKSFADMAPKEPNFIDVMNAALGEEETRAFFAEWSLTYKSGDDFLIRYRPGLSDYGESE